jgi:UDP-N-acetylglucosamine 2-epimerase (non-hydrolysing)
MEAFAIDLERRGVQFVEPLGFFDFVRLEQSAFCILTDSGTVQEEACLFGTPNVTIRDVTERPETIEAGSNVLSGSDGQHISHLVELVTKQQAAWKPPAEYLATGVAERIVRILLSFRLADASEKRWLESPTGS